MTNVEVPRAYEAIDDSEELRIVVRELRRVHCLIGQLADVACERPGVPAERANGIRIAGSFVLGGLVRAAEVRLLELAMGQPDSGERADVNRSSVLGGMPDSPAGWKDVAR